MHHRQHNHHITNNDKHIVLFCGTNSRIKAPLRLEVSWKSHLSCTWRHHGSWLRSFSTARPGVVDERTWGTCWTSRCTAWWRRQKLVLNLRHLHTSLNWKLYSFVLRIHFCFSKIVCLSTVEIFFSPFSRYALIYFHADLPIYFVLKKRKAFIVSYLYNT